jgi:hypothetical protein
MSEQGKSSSSYLLHISILIDSRFFIAVQYFQSRENPTIRKAFAETEEEQALNVIHHTDLLMLIEQYSADEIIEEVIDFTDLNSIMGQSLQVFLNTNKEPIITTMDKCFSFFRLEL